MALDATAVLEHMQLSRQARAMGMTDADIKQFGDRIEDFRQEIQRRKAGSSWFDKMASFRVRRKKLAAAYLAGASLNQLALLESITAKAIHDLTAKELPADLRDRIAQERTQRGRRRVPIYSPTQVSAMTAAVTNTDALNLPVIVLAARMQAAASAPETREDDENDPYLRDEAGAESNRTGEGQDGRGDGDRQTPLHSGGDVPSEVGGSGA